ncbi:MAG: hypothetical protein ABI725_00270 [Chloroflexota bacterium]
MRRVRTLPWSDKSIVLVTLLVVSALAPAWLDPATFAAPRTPAPGPVSPAARTPDTHPQGSPIVVGPSVVIASDTFSRAVDDGWGAAEVGGEYSTSVGVERFGVETGNGLVTLPIAGATGSVVLPTVSARDVDIKFGVRVDELPQGEGSLFVYALLRSTVAGLAYRPRIRIDAGGAVFAHVGLLLAGGSQSLGREVLAPDVRVTPGKLIWLRAQATGSDPTLVRVRTWEDGQEEPSYWHFAVIDWTGSLQGSGSVGLSALAGLRTVGSPYEFAFSGLLAATTDQP